VSVMTAGFTHVCADGEASESARNAPPTITSTTADGSLQVAINTSTASTGTTTARSRSLRAISTDWRT
jgi:hypothetical protein